MNTLQVGTVIIDKKDNAEGLIYEISFDAHYLVLWSGSGDFEMDVFGPFAGYRKDYIFKCFEILYA